VKLRLQSEQMSEAVLTEPASVCVDTHSPAGARSESAGAICESVFAVDDMFCGGCAATVERAVRRLSGVVDVSVSFLGDTAIVQHNPAQIEEHAIRKAITRLGYNTRAVNDKAQASQVSEAGVAGLA